MASGAVPWIYGMQSLRRNTSLDHQSNGYDALTCSVNLKLALIARREFDGSAGSLLNQS